MRLARNSPVYQRKKFKSTFLDFLPSLLNLKSAVKHYIYICMYEILSFTDVESLESTYIGILNPHSFVISRIHDFMLLTRQRQIFGMLFVLSLSIG